MDFNPQTPQQFDEWVNQQVAAQGLNRELLDCSLKHHALLGQSNRFYMNRAFGLPVLQTADDLLQLSDIIWNYKPSLIIETGVARGGSILYHASQLLILQSLGLINIFPKVVGIDVLIHDYNRDSIESSPFSDYIHLVEASSTSASIPTLLNTLVPDFEQRKKIFILDSNHEEKHVLDELNLYSSFCLPGDYIIVFDTLVEYLDEPHLADYSERPWSKGSNPLTAVNKFLAANSSFRNIDFIDNKLICSGAINGWLRKSS